MRYNNNSKEKENGIVYTPPDMANYMADEMIKYGHVNAIDIIEVLDPAVGKGELLVSMINELKAHYSNQIRIVGYETDSEVCRETEKRLKSLFPDVQVCIRNEDFLKAVEDNTTGQYDFVIANPPYIRTQIMGSNRAQEIAEKLSLSGRIDIYYAFLVYTKKALKETGVSGYITSNKFLTIKSGCSVRNYILANYKIHQITDLGDTKLFSASVLPCILIFSKGVTTDRNEVKFTSVYETTELCEKNIKGVFEAIYDKGVFITPNNKKYKFQQGILQSVETDALWNLLSDEIQEWLMRVDQKTWMRFSDLGKIRVGIKTTADNVFIGSEWTGKNAELEWLRPLITHRNASQILPNNNEPWKVLYTHTYVDGKKQVLDINEAPMTKEYLMRHYEQLAGRQYVIKAKRQWYEIWVPQNPKSWEHRKIVFRDISEEPQFWLDNSKAVVNGDCYWIDISPDIFDDVIYLALAIANSKFIKKYYDIKFNTKLYSGKRRYMTQYVEQFPIPHCDTEVAHKVIELVKNIVAENNYKSVPGHKKALDDLVDQLFE